MRLRHIFIFTFITFVLNQSNAQNNRVEGKIIAGFGETFPVINPEIATDIEAVFKVIFDVSTSSQEKNVINKYMVSAARFLNMHANEGMSPEQLKVAMTVHGGAWQDVLTDKAYKKKFGVENPNTELIDQLTEAGVDIIICGQTASSRGMSRSDVNPKVKFSLSAMTALLQYQHNGYTFIKF